MEDECEGVELKGKYDWSFPKWAEGVFVTSGPSKHEMNKTKFAHVLDGYGRFSNVNFRDGKALFTSKMIKSNFYNRSMSQGNVASTILFAETIPPRWKSMIPGLNFYHSFQTDNNWVSLELLADNKTFVGTTDSNKKLEIDLMSMDTRELIQWEDDGLCMSGVSHSRKLPDGTYISICGDLNKETYKMDLVVYKMVGENTRKRVVIARIPMDRSSIQHAFAMTREYAIIFDPPWYAEPSLIDLVFSNIHFQEMIKNDINGTTKIYAVRLSDGKVTKFDAKKWSMILHFGNAYQPDDDTIVVEGPAYEKPDSNPFKIFLHENIQNAAGLTGHNHGSLFKRYILNLKDLTVKMEDLVPSEFGSIDLPSYNPKWEGVGKNRYTYLF